MHRGWLRLEMSCAMRAWLLLAALLPNLALGQVHVKQPFKYAWDYAAGTAERFELQLDGAAYVSVGLPPFAAGTYTLVGDPALMGAHSAVVRACTAALGCSVDSNTVAFIVDVPAPTPIPAAPTGLRIVASIALPPPVLVESPTGAKVFVVGTEKIIDAKLDVWTLGPKDPAIEGGLEFTILINGVREGGAATFLCYSNHQVFSWSGQPNGNWYAWTGTAFQLFSPAVPVGCA